MANDFSYLNRDGSFLGEQGRDRIDVFAPTTGSTITAIGSSDYVFINTGTLAALTVKLPPGPDNGQKFEIGFAGAITAITFQDSAGNAIAGAPTAAAAGVCFGFRYLANIGGGTGLNKWVRWE